MQDIYLGLKFSFSYFSTIPVSFKESDNLSKREVLGYMLLFFPIVGFTIGSITILIFKLFHHFGWYGAVISAVIYMMLYGFIHTEAIIDVVDGIYAKYCGKDSYKIVKEPTVGAMGVLYAFGFMIIKISTIVYIFEHNLLSEFISVLIVSRLSLIVLIDTLDFKSSFITTLKKSLTPIYLIGSFVISMIIGTLLTPFFIIMVVFGFILSFIISIYISKRLGFINGDVLGTTLEGVEILLLFLIVVFML